MVRTWHAAFLGTLIAATTLSFGLSSVAGGASGLTASAPGVTSSTITIGYLSSLTGLASSTFADGPAGVRAAIDQQNAQGGVDGRKLKLIVKDDASSLTTDATNAQQLAGDTFGVVDFSPFTFSGAPALNKAGVPVTGDEFDGPEWGQQPYSNMFTWGPPLYTTYGGVFYTYTDVANFMKSIGITKLANLAFGISPSATQAAKDAAAAAKATGISANCYDDFTVPYGSSDFTADALAIRQDGCNGVEAPMEDASDVALQGALAQGGSKNVKGIYYTGYSEDVITNTAANQSFQNAYVEAGINFTKPSPGVKAMLDAITKYNPGINDTLPDLGLYGSYISAELMIKGLELAGKNPTRQAFISQMRRLTNWNANGILPTPVSFTHFGTKGMLPPRACTYFVQLKGKKFVLADGGKLVCGKLIPVENS
jgi:branched-chain amino acid transport system substrate-binding protein